MTQNDNNPLLQRPGESDAEYHKRLVYGKLVDKTLSEYDYSELSKYVYGQSYSADVARRQMYGSCKTLQLIESESIGNVKDSTILDEINTKMIELQKERQRFYDQRREFNKLVNNDGRKEHLYDSLILAANKLNETVGNIFDDSKYDDYSYIEREKNEAVLVFSDWHYGLKASNVFNTYNTEICKQRVKRIVDSAIERIVLHGCKKLHVAVLGDLIHGAIHTSARVASEELVCDQLIQVSEILAQSIAKMSIYTEKVCVYVTYGNHARTVQNKNDSIHRDNIERLIPWWLEQRFQQIPNIEIMPESGSEFLFINAAGHDICATHGDLDSVKSAPRLLPSLLNKALGKNIECILLADKHHRESFEELGVSSMICGSLCGSDDFANNKRLYSMPSQILLIVNPVCGIDAEYNLVCK